MAQQINLYNPALRRQRQWLTLSNVLLLAGVFALSLVATGFVLRAQVAARVAAVSALDGKLATLRIEVAQLGNQLGGAGAEQAARELAELKLQVSMRREVLDAMKSGAGVDAARSQMTAGFADYLRGLARQSVNGLWLTGFSVAQGGDVMEVRGRMLAVDRLPEYIKRLNGEARFKGRQFVSLNISRPDRANPQPTGGTPYASFVLSAQPESKDGKDAKTKDGGR